MVAHQASSFREHAAPLRKRGLRAESDKAEGGAGQDAAAAMDALSKLIEGGFDE